MGTTTLDINDIKWLRENTGAGIMEARKALQDADGDREKAKVLLEQRLGAKAAKRSNRAASQGVVESYIHAGSQIGVLVELNSETDFVARTPEFKQLAREIAMQVAATSPQYASMDDIPEEEASRMKAVFREEAVKDGREKVADKIAEGRFQKWAKERVLLEQPYIRDDKRTIKQLVHELGAKTGENVVIRRFERFQVGT
jgi:elongation factor Ts